MSDDPKPRTLVDVAIAYAPAVAAAIALLTAIVTHGR